jgi:large subunit ribosomal protein L33
MAAERHTFVLSCKVCKNKNYYFVRSKKRTADNKLALKKFCNTCRKQTDHKETKP